MTQKKAKRKLSDISFEQEGAHIALVSKKQGGPANGADYSLVLKGTHFSQEFIEKVQQVKVTLELPEFLRKFFSMYYEDAEILARMMGYVAPTPTNVEAPMSHEDYIQSKLQAFEIMKSVNDCTNLAEALSQLDETEYMAMLEDQVELEKAFAKQESDEATGNSVSESVPSTNAGVEKSVEPTGSELQQLEKSEMTQEVNKEVAPTVEMVEKSVLESIQKAFDEQKVALEKALETVAQFEADKKSAVEKAKTEQIQAIVKDEVRTQAIAKAALSLESEDDFSAFVAAIQAMMATVETSEMFVEKGASVQEEAPVIQESAVAKVLKAKLTK